MVNECPNCHKTLNRNINFCTHCGFNLKSIDTNQNSLDDDFITNNEDSSNDFKSITADVSQKHYSDKYDNITEDVVIDENNNIKDDFNFAKDFSNNNQYDDFTSHSIDESHVDNYQLDDFTSDFALEDTSLLNQSIGFEDNANKHTNLKEDSVVDDNIPLDDFVDSYDLVESDEVSDLNDVSLKESEFLSKNELFDEFVDNFDFDDDSQVNDSYNEDFNLDDSVNAINQEDEVFDNNMFNDNLVNNINLDKKINLSDDDLNIQIDYDNKKDKEYSINSDDEKSRDFLDDFTITTAEADEVVLDDFTTGEINSDTSFNDVSDDFNLDNDNDISDDFNLDNKSVDLDDDFNRSSQVNINDDFRLDSTSKVADDFNKNSYGINDTFATVEEDVVDDFNRKRYGNDDFNVEMDIADDFSSVNQDIVDDFNPVNNQVDNLDDDKKNVLDNLSDDFNNSIHSRIVHEIISSEDDWKDDFRKRNAYDDNYNSNNYPSYTLLYGIIAALLFIIVILLAYIIFFSG